MPKVLVLTYRGICRELHLLNDSTKVKKHRSLATSNISLVLHFKAV